MKARKQAMSDVAIPIAQVKERVRREFHFNGAKLADPDPKMKPEEVRKFYAGNGYAALTNATTSAPEYKDGKEIYTFKGSVGTKG
jgi:PRTRC genetic system protein C